MEDNTGCVAEIIGAIFLVAIAVKLVEVGLHLVTLILPVVLMIVVTVISFAGLGVGSNLLVRTLIGLGVNRVGEKETAIQSARLGLIIMYVSPEIVTGTLLLIALYLHPANVVGWALNASLFLPAYYLTWWASKVPVPQWRRGRLTTDDRKNCDLPFRSEALMRAEETLLVVRFLLWLNYQFFRLRIS